jgi:membrane fusion protein, multidrug efflux system
MVEPHTPGARRWALHFLLLPAILLAACGPDAAPPAPPPPAVEVLTLAPRDVPLYQDFVGQLKGAQDTDVRAQVQGVVQSIDYQEGTEVEVGAQLFTIDPRPFESALQQAQASASEARIRYENARRDAERYITLARKGVIPRKQADDAEAQAKAQQQSYNAAMALVDGKQVDLGYTRVTAPIAGRAGIAQVEVGDLVGGPGSKPMVVISKSGDVKARFSVSENDYLRIFRQRQAERATGQEPPPIPVRLVLSDGGEYDKDGRITSIDSTVDSTTGTLTVEALFPNPDGLLRSGQYGKVRALTSTQRNVLLLPQRAVTETQGTYTVAVVGVDNKVEIRRVEMGERSGNDWIVKSGLKVGERVVVEGLGKARSGTVVAPREMAAATAPGGGS